MRNVQSLLKTGFNSIKSIFIESAGAQKYRTLLMFFLNDEIITPKEMEQLEFIKNRYSLKSDEVRKIQGSVFSMYYKKINSDQRITEKELNSLNTIIRQFNFNIHELKNFDQIAFNRSYSLGLIESGNLPEIKPENHNLNIILGKDEKLHFADMAILRKFKKITEKISYSGLSYSIKIMKGVRYRAGSVKVHTDTKNVLHPIDSGFIYLTDIRLGFKGNNKHFEINLNKILSFELNQFGFYIFKRGKETPYILTLDDYDVLLGILSILLNNVSSM